MATMIKEPYSGEALEVKNKLLSGRQSFRYNKLYLDRKLNTFYINNKNYVHIVKVSPIRYNDCIMEYRCNDLKMTKKNLLESSGDYLYSSKRVEDCFEYILQNLDNKDDINISLVDYYRQAASEVINKVNNQG